LKPGTQYLLSKESGGSTPLTRIFDIDPSLHHDDDHMTFARYLKERVLTIDLWNGDSLMHFGTCKVPLHAFLRQGEQSKVTAQEYEIAENEYGLAVGGLQILVANEGRKTVIPEGGEKNKEVEKKHKKKVISKPIESIGGMGEG
jgi:hypothetical protein